MSRASRRLLPAAPMPRRHPPAPPLLFVTVALILVMLAGMRPPSARAQACPDDFLVPDACLRPEPQQAAMVTPEALPSGFVKTEYARGFTRATAMQFAPDGRLFVSEQDGRVRVIKNGIVLSTPFLSLTVRSSGESGLQSIAFDPNFASNRYVYVFYTATSPAVHNRVSRFTANGDVAVPGSEAIIFEMDNTTSDIHNGGALQFGRDGKLYISVGDAAHGPNAQTLSNLWGKVLRINPDGSIPTDNPFYNTASGNRRAIWAYGLRNPFTIAVQPGSGRMFINDVGLSAWEEINEGVAGSNYGWPTTEGPTSDSRFRSPLYAYGHDQGCAIVGGAFYNPPTSNFPSDYTGDYFFGDYCQSDVRRFDPVSRQVTSFATGLDPQLVDIELGSDGRLYMLQRQTGAVHRISFSGGGGGAPVITTHPSNQTVPEGGSATFSCAASGAAPLAYQWQRNGADIAGATGTSYTISRVSMRLDNGARFRCRVSNSAGSAVSNEATLTVSNDRPPAASITSPAAGARYNAGQTISYSGSGTDPEDGTLPASAFTWRVDFHHDTHTHPFIAPTSGATSGSFTIPTTGETSANVWYRIHLTVRDSDGLTHSVFRDLLPNTATITLATSPSALQVTLDGQPFTAPHTFESVVGLRRSIGAPSPQTRSGVSYQFDRWSDGGAATHTIATPAADTTYTATFRTGSGGSGTTVYSDALGPGWQDWSWDSTVNLAATSPVHTGSRAIALTVTSAWGALNLHADPAVDLTGTSHLTFAARASQTGQRYAVALVGTNGQQLRAPIGLDAYGGDPRPGVWTVYRIPLSDLGAAGARVSGLQIQDRLGRAQPALYLDDIAFTSGSAPASATVYADALGSGWEDWSWDSTVNLAATSPVHAGSRAIALTVTAAWGALNLHTTSPVDVSAYTHLQLAARASQSGQRYAVALLGANGQQLHAPIGLDAYGGDPRTDGWTVYRIPLSDLGAAGARVAGIQVQDRLGRAQPAVFLDSIAFTD